MKRLGKSGESKMNKEPSDITQIRHICKHPMLGDRLEDKSGDIWVIATGMTLKICMMRIIEGEEFVYIT